MTTNHDGHCTSPTTSEAHPTTSTSGVALGAAAPRRHNSPSQPHPQPQPQPPSYSAAMVPFECLIGSTGATAARSAVAAGPAATGKATRGADAAGADLAIPLGAHEAGLGLGMGAAAAMAMVTGAGSDGSQLAELYELEEDDDEGEGGSGGYRCSPSPPLPSLDSSPVSQHGAPAIASHCDGDSRQQQVKITGCGEKGCGDTEGEVAEKEAELPSDCRRKDGTNDTSDQDKPLVMQRFLCTTSLSAPASSSLLESTWGARMKQDWDDVVCQAQWQTNQDKQNQDPVQEQSQDKHNQDTQPQASEGPMCEHQELIQMQVQGEHDSCNQSAMLLSVDSGTSTKLDDYDHEVNLPEAASLKTAQQLDSEMITSSGTMVETLQQHSDLVTAKNDFVQISPAQSFPASDISLSDQVNSPPVPSVSTSQCDKDKTLEIYRRPISQNEPVPETQRQPVERTRTDFHQPLAEPNANLGGAGSHIGGFVSNSMAPPIVLEPQTEREFQSLPGSNSNLKLGCTAHFNEVQPFELQYRTSCNISLAHNGDIGTNCSQPVVTFGNQGGTSFSSTIQQTQPVDSEKTSEHGYLKYQSVARFEIQALENAEVEIIGEAIQHRPGGPPHICSKCSFPIWQYSILQPCMHALCRRCAQSLTVSSCPICKGTLSKVDHLSTQSVFICPVPSCLRSYPSEIKLVDHQKLRKHTPKQEPLQLTQVPLNTRY
ncbi:E3 ubiquitin-protein ligase Hakai [Pelomyxa schiedti]|nr:E3 ubiquitin-protein ligase Hakai [Pelomyxa schiedti]